MFFSRRGTRKNRGCSADVAQLVERNLAKVEVAGSNPVVRSEKVRQAAASSGGTASLVEWPRGEATDCKSVYTGSNPVSTSRTIGAAVARFPDTEEVTGSIPVSSTKARGDEVRGPRRLRHLCGCGGVLLAAGLGRGGC